MTARRRPQPPRPGGRGAQGEAGRGAEPDDPRPGSAVQPLLRRPEHLSAGRRRQPGKGESRGLFAVPFHENMGLDSEREQPLQGSGWNQLRLNLQRPCISGNSLGVSPPSFVGHSISDSAELDWTRV